MNEYIKRLIKFRTEHLEMEEQEIEKEINSIKEQLNKREGKLKIIQEEKKELIINIKEDDYRKIVNTPHQKVSNK